MALASDPKVLLLDEPLAGMGPEEGERMVVLLQSLAREHAVLLIEHDMDFVFKVADRMTVLVEGAVLATGTPAEVRANRRRADRPISGGLHDARASAADRGAGTCIRSTTRATSCAASRSRSRAAKRSA